MSLFEAIVYYDKALALDPHHRSSHNNLGNILRGKNQLEEAIAHFLLIQKDHPEHINSLNGLGACYASLGKHQKAADYFKKIIEIKPDDYNAHTNLGIELLLMGEFEQGWDAYAWRFYRPDLKRTFNCPLWEGEALENKRLLIHAEQGAGDVIQFLRYLPHVKTLGAEIIFECHKPLYKLCFQQTGIDIVVAKGNKLPKSDYHIPLLGLAQLFNTRKDNILNQVPYIYIDEKKQQKWESYFSSYKKLKVGLVWAGNPEHPNDKNRSCRLIDWLPFLKNQQVDFFSLQKNFGLQQLESLPEKIRITNLDELLFDYLDTAECVKQLDLIITVDTSVAHLAGALAKPVWVLLPYVPDWRWMLNSESSPWYPTMRLFRQHEIGNWLPVISEVEQALIMINQSP